MASENSSKTYLTLSYPVNDDQNPNHRNTKQNKRKISLTLKFDHVLPSLSLGLSQEQEEQREKFFNLSQATNSHSDVSSYSNHSMKREQDVINTEKFVVKQDSLRIASADHDEDGSMRKKLRLNKQQSLILENSFKEHNTLNPKQKLELAKQLTLRPRQVEVWFQNRRARTKLKQTESEYGLMKQYFETLTDENKRLQMELQELKAMKPTAPFNLRIPAATTMCPSCERIGNRNDVSGNSHFPNTGAKPYFYSTITHPSYAAC